MTLPQWPATVLKLSFSKTVFMYFILESLSIYRTIEKMVQRVLMYLSSCFPGANVLYHRGAFVTAKEPMPAQVLLTKLHISLMSPSLSVPGSYLRSHTASRCHVLHSVFQFSSFLGFHDVDSFEQHWSDTV